jgi:hypothetical protein
MPLTGAMRAWAVGEAVLVVDVALAAGLGLAQRQSTGSQGPLILLLGALVFFIPLAAALAVRTIRTRALFWVASVVPAVLWIPAIPAVFLRGGPDLASPSGLALAGAAIGGAVLATVGGALAAVEAAVAVPAGADVLAGGPGVPSIEGMERAEAVEPAAAPEPIEAVDTPGPAAAPEPIEAIDTPEPAAAPEPIEAVDAPEPTDAPGPIDTPGLIGAAEPTPAVTPADDPAPGGDPRAADDALVADLVRDIPAAKDAARPDAAAQDA